MANGTNLSEYYFLMISFTGFQVSKLGFGCAGLSGMLNAPLSHEAGCSIIREAFSRGITFFDTADIYGENHHNEYMVGKVCYSIFNFKPQLNKLMKIWIIYWTNSYCFGSKGARYYEQI